MEKLLLDSVSYLAFNLVSAIDHGYINSFTFDDIYQGLDNKNLLHKLEEKLGDTIDLSLLTKSEQGKLLVECLSGVAINLKQRERRKFGVESCGLCLLMAFCLEIMQSFDSYVK